jgi:3-dehydroquinate synthase
MDTVMHIYGELMAMGADRSTFLLGIGGGIVTDITGFVASTYMRGVAFGFVSTTLLGQVDASVGGKNGVNVASFKNMIGTITQPQFVISDVTMLGTLPERELRAGMAEVVKSAIVGDGELFDYIERCVSDGNCYLPEHLQYMVSRAMNVKMSIVAEDERESGKRRLLNLGHTIGHAIEKLTHDVNHGEAVAMGMSLIARAAVRLGLFSPSDAERVDALLLRLGFDISPKVPMEEILRATRQDKKKSDEYINIVLPVAIGECVVRKMKFEEFEKLFV